MLNPDQKTNPVQRKIYLFNIQYSYIFIFNCFPPTTIFLSTFFFFTIFSRAGKHKFTVGNVTCNVCRSLIDVNVIKTHQKHNSHD
jgi:hypothetical protein